MSDGFSAILGYDGFIENKWQPLAELLRCVTDGETAVSAAVGLYRKYGAIPTMLAADTDEVSRVCGLDANQVLLVKLVGYLRARDVIDGFEFGREVTEYEIIEYINALFTGVEVEEMHALFFDSELNVISSKYLGAGTVVSSDVYPRTLLELAVREGASGVILAHNHPKGFPEPSADDLEATRILSETLEISDIKLLAHYIAADGNIGKIEN